MTQVLTRSPTLGHPGYISGGTYPLFPTTGNASASLAADTLYLLPWVPEARVTPTSFGARVTTGGAGSAMKVGVWANDPATMRPTGKPLMANNAGAATTGTGEIMAAVSGAPLAPGVMVWVGAKFTGTMPSVIPCAGNMTVVSSLIGAGVSASTGNQRVGYSAASPYADDIGLTDLTAAALAGVSGPASMPLFLMGA